VFFLAGYHYHGKVTDATGVEYTYSARNRSVMHDPLPSVASEYSKLISKGNGSNFIGKSMVHINEHGEPIKSDFSIVCK